jgi:hypothetical protein
MILRSHSLFWAALISFSARRVTVVSVAFPHASSQMLRSPASRICPTVDGRICAAARGTHLLQDLLLSVSDHFRDLRGKPIGWDRWTQQDFPKRTLAKLSRRLSSPGTSLRNGCIVNIARNGALNLNTEFGFRIENSVRFDFCGFSPWYLITGTKIVIASPRSKNTSEPMIS